MAVRYTGRGVYSFIQSFIHSLIHSLKLQWEEKGRLQELLAPSCAHP
jgi:hypothetical protein